jgi:DNA-binding NarL/FixJ family response regulator
MSSVHTDMHPVVALVDHRDLTRIALIRSFSEVLPGAIVIGATRVADLAGHATDDLRVVILHIDHAETGNGSLSEVVTAARAAIGKVPLVTLSESSDEDSLRASIEGGASAHLTTGMPLELAAATLRLVMLGGTSFPAPASWIRRLARRATGGASAQCPTERLTHREEDVLKLVGEGAQNKIIAFRLNMSENTVKVHLHRILQKFHLHNRTEVALLAGTYFADTVRIPASPPIAANSQQMMAGAPERLPEAS